MQLKRILPSFACNLGKCPKFVAFTHPKKLTFGYKSDSKTEFQLIHKSHTLLFGYEVCFDNNFVPCHI